MKLPCKVRTPSPNTPVVSIVYPVKVYALLYLMQLVPHFIYVVAAASELAVAARGMDEGWKERDSHRITLTLFNVIFA